MTMTITLNTIYSWQSELQQKRPREPYDFFDALRLLCLDACTPFYKHLCLPASFDVRIRDGLQIIMRNYSRKEYPSYKKLDEYITYAYQELEKKIRIGGHAGHR